MEKENRIRDEENTEASLEDVESCKSETNQVLYLGLDLSTQSLTATVVNNAGVQTYTASVNFEAELQHHNTPVLRNPPKATMPSTLYLEALDLLFAKMKQQKFPFSSIQGVSGAAQQHGSVFLTKDFLTALSSLEYEYPLLPQIPQYSFSFPNGPIWEDSSTAEECAAIEKKLGGMAAMTAATGARATLRFTGPQILSRATKESASFDRTTRVALISAFLGSVLAGALIPEDVAEASGTHLFDLRSDPPQWLQAGVDAAHAQGKLSPAPVHSYTRVGTIQSYFCERYKFSPDTPIIAFTGDNPASLAALPELRRGDILISLGTSDTAQWLLSEDEVQTSEGGAAIAVTFRSPLCETPSYVRMLVYSNGSLTREAVRDGNFGVDERTRPAEQSWEAYEREVASVPEGCTPPKVACFYHRPEIAPRVPAEERARVYNAVTDEPTTASHAELCRLVLEWRALVFKVHLNTLGVTRPRRILLTGGAARSKAIPQVMADVLGVPVYRLQETASAALGAARRARVGTLKQRGINVPLAPVQKADKIDLAAKPRPQFVGLYRIHLRAYNRLFET